jgi:hypothetical protein
MLDHRSGLLDQRLELRVLRRAERLGRHLLQRLVIADLVVDVGLVPRLALRERSEAVHLLFGLLLTLVARRRLWSHVQFLGERLALRA